MQVRIVRPTNGAPAGKLAEAELRFSDGPLAGLRLVGFTIWEGRNGRGRHVTFPARQYVVNGERRHYTLLRAAGDAANGDGLREQILQAFADASEDDTLGGERNDGESAR